MATSKEKRDELLATATPLMAAILSKKKCTPDDADEGDWEKWLRGIALDSIDAAQALIHYVDGAIVSQTGWEEPE